MSQTERRRREWERHRAVGCPVDDEGYDGPCWGPTLADVAYVEEQMRTERAAETEALRQAKANR